MNASSQSLPGSAADAEITAELPVLDVAAYEARQGHDPLSSTDTWSSPSINTAVLPHLSSQSEAETVASATSATMASKLEGELRSLASNLTELETRLAAKGERLTAIESELAESRLAGQAAAARAAALSDELTGSRAAVAAITTQIETLRETLRTQEESLRAAAERETVLREAQAKRESEFTELAAVAAANSGEQIARHESAVQASVQQVAQLQAQSAAQLESLQALEGRRGIFDSMLRALDQQLLGRDQEQNRLAQDLARNTTHGLELTRELDSRAQRVTQLEAEVAALNSRLTARADEAGAIARNNEELNQSRQALRQESTARATRIAELEAQQAAADKTHAEALAAAAAAHSELQAAHATVATQHSALQTELTGVRAQVAEQAAAALQLNGEHAARGAQIEAQETQVAALSAQVAAQSQSLLAEAERSRMALERIAIAENDLRVSEEALNRLESELRSRNMRVEELTRINSQMQGDIGDARRWLGERDALMQRLESEAAHSAALVDNIQRSIRALAPSNTGSHEALREAGARLLVRSQDGHEVVHVLGRKTTIGRTPDNDLQIDASFISRHHAVLLLNGQQTILEDLNSTNGVHVNGHRISREILNDGDLVMIGKARFRFAIRPPRSSAEQSS